MNEIVSFEIAKLLKAAGFNLECYQYYNGYVDSSPSIGTCPTKTNPNALVTTDGSNGNRIDYYYSAPTIASVVDWIFETYDAWISVSREYTSGVDRELLGYESCIELEDGVDYSDTFKTPTEAYQAGIKTYLLTYIEPNI